MITKTVGKYPQESYAAVVCVIQLEWIYLQRAKKYMGNTFEGVEDILWETFLPRLFFGKSKSISPLMGTLSTIPAKKISLGLQEPSTPPNKKYLSLLCTSSNLIGAVI